jgi:N-methylhydantoinase A
MRYKGQAYEITVNVPNGEFDEAAVETAANRFHEEHARLYGHAMRDEPLEAVTLRTDGTVTTTKLEDKLATSNLDAERGEREVYFSGEGYLETAIYNRNALGPGETVAGPAILEENGSTSIIPPETTAEISDYGSVIISL